MDEIGVYVLATGSEGADASPIGLYLNEVEGVNSRTCLGGPVWEGLWIIREI